MKIFFGIIFVIIPIFNFIEATTIKVPADQPTIQAGIDAAIDGDIVLVADGTYTGAGNKNIGFRGQEIIVRSENGPQNCIIDCENSDMSVAFSFTILDREKDIVVEGFTIRNAWTGIEAYLNSSPTIAKNIIENCETGIYCWGEAAPLIIGNTIRNNNNLGGMAETGGGIRLTASAATIMNNIIYDNTSAKGGGIYCSNSESATIINNTIIGNTASANPTSDDPILNCEYDNHNRIYECFVQNIPSAVSGGGGIYIEDSSPEIMNNIIAFSKEPSVPEPSGLSRWYLNDLFMHYNYEGASLKSVIYYYGFKNNGEAGDITISGCDYDNTFTIQSGERYWMEMTSWVSPSGDGGGIDLEISLNNSSLNLNVDLGGFFGGCYYFFATNLQSYGVAKTGVAQSGMYRTGIVAIRDISTSDIAYNDFYGNDGGNDIGSVGAGNIGNISQDPLCEAPDYLLDETSPCIDAGNPDSQYNDNSLPPGLGTERCDIGASGGPRNDLEITLASEEDYTVVPSKILLYQNYPNPFNPSTTIKYGLEKDSQVKVEIYVITGQLITTLQDNYQTQGWHSLVWNGTNHKSEKVPAGQYICKITMGDEIRTTKLMLLK